MSTFKNGLPEGELFSRSEQYLGRISSRSFRYPCKFQKRRHLLTTTRNPHDMSSRQRRRCGVATRGDLLHVLDDVVLDSQLGVTAVHEIVHPRVESGIVRLD